MEKNDNKETILVRIELVAEGLVFKQIFGSISQGSISIFKDDILKYIFHCLFDSIYSSRHFIFKKNFM